MNKSPAVYIMASERNGTLYIGVTGDLIRRAWEHREHAAEGFTKTYGVDQLVWFELHDVFESAIRREKQLKKWKREWKIDLIEKENPYWHDRWPGLVGGD
ncbi:GIY-YIG nuclease family protein [Lysobacter sp. 5GHs7-4]|uniref:GIY-YIG nuclease family protein n=1 Tax=Lysobacter sp. 5GHs7-4 TaxID=2904253 RepID=UPI001E561839|nr:GIY-YIG nuclease family protein [Lysobacter sp. 5GHs7-4]UHQ21332.1 GIY-YIG nuclease family protein [Lysobacter sp. 5GHs7-4]